MRWYNVDGTPIGGTFEQQVMAGSELLASSAARKVAYDDIRVAGEQVTISTVFLCLDHDLTAEEHVPVLYETRIQGGVHNGKVSRYTSRQAAEEGHVAALARARLLPR